MRQIIIVGAGKFAVEVVSYVRSAFDGQGIEIVGHLAGEERESHVGTLLESWEQHSPDAATEYVLGISSPDERRKIHAEFFARHDVRAPVVTHPTAVVGDGVHMGRGTLVGPHCYIGANAHIGCFNVFNANCSIGHHSSLGDGNFFSPDVHLGNSTSIGSHNFFGIGVLAVHELSIGDANRIQAGTTVTESLESGDLVTAVTRFKRVGLYRGTQNG